MDQSQIQYRGYIIQNAVSLGGAPITDERQVRVDNVDEYSSLSMHNIKESKKREKYLEQQKKIGQDAITYDVYTKASDKKLGEARLMSNLDQAIDGGTQKTIQLGPDTVVIVTRHHNAKK